MYYRVAGVESADRGAALRECSVLVPFKDEKMLRNGGDMRQLSSLADMRGTLRFGVGARAGRRSRLRSFPVPEKRLPQDDNYLLFVRFAPVVLVC